MLPEWVLKHKKPGTTVKKIGKNYYLYYASSMRVPGKKYPVSTQTYIGKITETGVINDKVSIRVGDTEARLISDIVQDLEDRFSKVIVLRIHNKWMLTSTDAELVQELEQKGVCHNGEVIL